MISRQISASHPFRPPIADEIGIVAVVDIAIRHTERGWVDVVDDQAQRVDPRLLRHLQTVVGGLAIGEIGLEHVELGDELGVKGIRDSAVTNQRAEVLVRRCQFLRANLTRSTSTPLSSRLYSIASSGPSMARTRALLNVTDV